MFAVSNDKRHGIVRITGHDPGVQARGPPARVPFHCIPWFPLIVSFATCYKSLSGNREALLFVKPANKIKNAHAAYNDCATL